MADQHAVGDNPTAVTLWLDPVCPFTWNTARWLTSAAAAGRAEISWRLLNLAVLNEGREMPSHLQQRMRDSRSIGRLMSAIRRDLGEDAMVAAYFTFGGRHFDEGVPVNDDLVKEVLTAAGASGLTPDVVDDAALDVLVAQSHQAGQDAYGAVGGSPMLTIGGHTFFGPVFAELPATAAAPETFTALATLAAVPQFSQLERPRNH